MIRIKYEKDGNTLISEPMLANKVFVYIQINTDSLIYAIKNASTHVIIHKGGEPTLNETKAKVKQCLKDMGAQFDDEIRISHKTDKFKL